MTTASDINPFEVEAPALLVQPLVENSVIHGVSALAGSGHIEIWFTRRDNDMIARIEDNGRGFDPETNTDGYGLALTRRRIAFINEMSHDRWVAMEINTTKGGTSIFLTFKNWLA
jgi:LytS/YehU family sensor histidine kinase